MGFYALITKNSPLRREEEGCRQLRINWGIYTADLHIFRIYSALFDFYAVNIAAFYRILTFNTILSKIYAKVKENIHFVLKLGNI